MSLDFRTLDPHDDSDEHGGLLRGWLHAVVRGFHEGRVKSDSEDIWLRAARADDATLRGAWLPEGAYGAGPMPVATFASFGGDLNTGRGLVPLQFITDVTVSPAHRRHGLLRRLMTEDLAAAVEAGRPLAALTVSEGSIYGRFGFGISTWHAEVEVDVTSRFALPGHTAYGSFAALEPADLWPVPKHLFERWHERQRGSLSRPAYYDIQARGEWDWENRAPDDKLRGAVHLDEAGEPDGYVLYKHEGWERPRTVTVRDLVATSPRAHLSLWRYLADIDLCERVKAVAPVDDPLTWALADPQCRSVNKVRDHIWLRVLDVVTALEARPWSEDGTVVLGISDALGHAEGRWRVTTSGGAASVERCRDEPDVELDVSALSALYVGGVDVPTLAAAGRLAGSPELLATWAAMSDGGPTPFSKTSF